MPAHTGLRSLPQSLLQRQGKLDEAESVCRRFLEQCDQSLGKTHPATMNMANNLKIVLAMKEQGPEVAPK